MFRLIDWIGKHTYRRGGRRALKRVRPPDGNPGRDMSTFVEYFCSNCRYSLLKSVCAGALNSHIALVHGKVTARCARCGAMVNLFDAADFKCQEPIGMGSVWAMSTSRIILCNQPASNVWAHAIADGGVSASFSFFCKQHFELLLHILNVSIPVGPTDDSTKARRAELEAHLTSPFLIRPPGNRADFLRGLLQKLSSVRVDPKLYVAPKIPQKKLRNAIASYANRVNEDEVLALGDATWFGSAKKGCLLTFDGYHHDHWGHSAFSWQEVRGAHTVGGIILDTALEVELCNGTKTQVVCRALPVDWLGVVFKQMELYNCHAACEPHISQGHPTPDSNPARLQCKCGKKLRVPASLAGKRLTCPACGETIALK